MRAAPPVPGPSSAVTPAPCGGCSPAWSETVCRAVLDAPADRAGGVLADALGAVWDADTVEIGLVDRAGSRLHLVAGPDTAVDRALAGTVAAEAMRSGRPGRERTGGRERVHVPMSVRGTVHGVLVAVGPRPDVTDAELLAGAELAAILLAQASTVTDHFEIRRRSAAFSVSAEFQWQLLPATSMATGPVELHALVEPAPRVTSDLFDWSLDGDVLTLAVLDAEGHDLSAALPAALAVAALRHARRCGTPLAEQAALADQAVYGHFRGRAVVRAVLAVLDLGAGTAQMVRAGGVGAPRVFRRRAGRAEELELVEQEDLGRFDRSFYAAHAVDLGPGDDLLVVSDGGPGARDGAGAEFGVEAVAEHLGRADGLAAVPRELLDALRTHVGGPGGGELDEDATAMVVGWRHPAR